MPLLEIEALSKSYPDGWTLSGVHLTVEEGESLCLLGPSGCGKTTLLRLIAGLERPDGGRILLDGADVTFLPPHRRPFGLMFQEYALFPHKDVFGNVSFGLRMVGWEREALRARTAEVLALVGLEGFERRDVNQLSGGEQQRVALARSLAPKPRLLLLDEPLGALDRALRERLLEDLPAILDHAGVTSITVTHDQEEAFAVADHIVVMHAGRVVQQGTPQAVYARPVSAWVARFLGLTNLLPARVVAPGEVETALGRLRVADTSAAGAESATLLVRPEAAQPQGEGGNRIAGVVTGRTFRGSHFRLTLGFPGDVTLTFEWSAREAPPAVGVQVALALDPAGLVLL
ncbi:MAG: ABC transporter ATP-binding protein [Anaerolineae bacterium]|nr:ABC transporter ATP-binding protein [Anaerolineae bacterium]